MVEVLLASALICFDGNCYPALVGPKTKEGEFQLIQRLTQSAGYGGDVLQFYETEHSVQANTSSVDVKTKSTPSRETSV